MDPSILKTLHEATLTLLERTGVRVESQQALELFNSHDVPVDRKTRRVRPLPEHLARALATAPRSFELYGRWTGNPLVVGGSTSVAERATAVARDILSRHRPQPLAPEVAAEVRRIALGGLQA